MTRYKLVFSLVLLSFIFFGEKQRIHAAPQSEAIFSNAAFWGRLPAFPEMQKAWKNGAVIQKEAGRYGVFYAGSLFGFVEHKIPADHGDAQTKLTQVYIQRAEQRAVQTLGVFAFNDFDCAALADFDQIQPDIAQCKNIELKAKVAAEWEMQAFGIIQASASSLCACRKALDKGNEKDNTSSFYGAIARAEVRRLYDGKRIDEAIAFFTRNYARKIFLPPELILIADCFAQKSDTQNALTILNALRDRYAATLTSQELEQCGDVYYALGNSEDAIKMYELSSKALFERNAT